MSLYARWYCSSYIHVPNEVRIDMEFDLALWLKIAEFRN